MLPKLLNHLTVSEISELTLNFSALKAHIINPPIVQKESDFIVAFLARLSL
jgi:hypothetical protein